MTGGGWSVRSLHSCTLYSALGSNFIQTLTGRSREWSNNYSTNLVASDQRIPQSHIGFVHFNITSGRASAELLEMLHICVCVYVCVYIYTSNQPPAIMWLQSRPPPEGCPCLPAAASSSSASSTFLSFTHLSSAQFCRYESGGKIHLK